MSPPREAVPLGFRRVLAISPHTDDVEFGAGATIARLAREGAAVQVVAFSYTGDQQLIAEFRSAAAALGTKLISYDDVPVRHFGEHRQTILDALIRRRGTFYPDLIICPSTFDRHQDHQVVAAECVRAFRGITTLGYVLPWNCPSVSVTGWVAVTEEDVERKVSAVGRYVSQAHRPYANAAAVRASVITAGLQSGVPLAEPFEVIRWVGVSDG